MTISAHTEKALDKIQHAFIIKALNKLGIKGNFLNLVKSIYINLQLILYLMMKHWMLSP